MFKAALASMTNDFESASKLYEEYPDEYKRFEVSRKVAQVLLTNLSNETRDFDLYLCIRNVLTIGKQEEDSEPRNEDLMYALFAKCWLPPTRSFLQMRWEPRSRDTFTFIDQLGKWTYLMPDRFKLMLMTSHILPRLESELTCTQTTDFAWLCGWGSILT